MVSDLGRFAETASTSYAFRFIPRIESRDLQIGDIFVDMIEDPDFMVYQVLTQPKIKGKQISTIIFKAKQLLWKDNHRRKIKFRIPQTAFIGRDVKSTLYLVGGM